MGEVYRAEDTNDIAPDGQRFLMYKRGDTAPAPAQINIVLNWIEELKRLVPIN